MDEHLIFLIDILGFGQAVSSWGEEKKAKLVQLVRDLASLRSDSAFAITPISEGQSHVHIPPAISTFSDHIVISYPTEHLQNLVPKVLDMGLHFSKQLVGAVAAETVKLGLLIRGGATVGPLYHAGGVVVGEAMIEAHYLESQVANYPRIAVSRKLYSRISAPGGESLLLKDADGITHFDYFKDMIMGGSNPVLGGREPAGAGVFRKTEGAVCRRAACHRRKHRPI